MNSIWTREWNADSTEYLWELSMSRFEKLKLHENELFNVLQ